MVAEGFPQEAVSNHEEVVLQETNQLLQSINDRFKAIQTKVLAKFADFKPYVVEIEKSQYGIEENVDEEHVCSIL